MIKVSKRFLERAKPALRKYQKLFADARVRDVNESDTVVIVSDFLSDVLGYDKYKDLTTEFAIRCTFCDLAIKFDGKLSYLIEVKSIGTDLKENHVRQAVDYGAKQGCEWVILTNGAEWKAYRIRYEQPLDYDLAFSVDLLATDAKLSEQLQLLSLIAKESGSGKEIDRFWQHKEATSRYVIAQLFLQDSILGVVRRELRKLSPGVKVDRDELTALISNEILKRDVLEGEKAESAVAFVKKMSRRRARKRAADQAEAPVVPESAGARVPQPTAS
jgi:hypothetical protein